MAFRPRNVERATDVLVTGFTSANTNLLQLGEAFTYVGPVAKAAGLAFEETTAALALMGNAGFQGSLAGTSLRSAITKLLTPTAAGADIIERMGLQVFQRGGRDDPVCGHRRPARGGGVDGGGGHADFRAARRPRDVGPHIPGIGCTRRN